MTYLSRAFATDLHLWVCDCTVNNSNSITDKFIQCVQKRYTENMYKYLYHNVIQCVWLSFVQFGCHLYIVIYRYL